MKTYINNNRKNRRENRKNFKKVAALTIASAILLGVTGCGNAEGGQSSAAGQTQAQESQDGVRKITISHSLAYAPYDFVDENGNSDGYEVAVLKAVDELLPQYEFVFEGTSEDDLLIGVESGKYQIGLKGVWWTLARTEKYVFPEHYVGASVTGLTIRQENADVITDMKSFADYSGLLVPLAPQNAQYTIVENYNKKNPDHPINLVAAEQFSNSDSYQWLLEGRYDAVFDIKAHYDKIVIEEGGEYHHLADQITYIPYEAIPTWPLFNSKEQQLADDYDQAWEKLSADGTLEKLQQQYFGYSLFDLVPEGYKKGDDL